MELESAPQYPSLHFEAYAVKGQNNQLTQPIYLPPLAVGPESAKIVGGNEDVILTIPGLEGFQMKVKAARLLKITPRQMGYALQKYGIEVRKF